MCKRKFNVFDNLEPIYLSVLSLATLLPSPQFPHTQLSASPTSAILCFHACLRLSSPPGMPFFLFSAQQKSVHPLILSVFESCTPSTHLYKVFFTYPKAGLIMSMSQILYRLLLEQLSQYVSIYVLVFLVYPIECKHLEDRNLLHKFLSLFLQRLAWYQLCTRYFLNIK